MIKVEGVAAMDTLPLDVLMNIGGMLPFVEEMRFLCHVSGSLRRRVLHPTNVRNISSPLPPLIANLMTLRPWDETYWSFLVHGVLGLECLKGKRFVAPEEKPDPKYADYVHLVEAVFAADGKSITVTQSFDRGVSTLPVEFKIRSLSSKPPPRALNAPKKEQVIAVTELYVVELHANGRLWMNGYPAKAPDGHHSKWSSCLVLEGALHLEKPPYVAQKVEPVLRRFFGYG
jgi:hypothetical protein